MIVWTKPTPENKVKGMRGFFPTITNQLRKKSTRWDYVAYTGMVIRPKFSQKQFWFCVNPPSDFGTWVIVLVSSVCNMANLIWSFAYLASVEFDDNKDLSFFFCPDQPHATNQPTPRTNQPANQHNLQKFRFGSKKPQPPWFCGLKIDEVFSLLPRGVRINMMRLWAEKFASPDYVPDLEEVQMGEKRREVNLRKVVSLLIFE